MSAKATTIARMGMLAAGMTIAVATMAPAAGKAKPAVTKASATAKTGGAKAATPAAVTPTPKPGQVVPTTPTAETSGAMTLPGGPESEAVAAPAAAAADPAKIAQGKELFTNFSCSSCHSLADAGADGHVGPALDGNKGLSYKLVVDRVTNGQGPMPAFAGQMTDEEIAAVSTYVVHAAKK